MFPKILNDGFSSGVEHQLTLNVFTRWLAMLLPDFTRRLLCLLGGGRYNLKADASLLKHATLHRDIDVMSAAPSCHGRRYYFLSCLERRILIVQWAP